MKKGRIIIVAVLLSILAYLFYFYPYQKYCAEKTFEKYISVQGITEEVIASKRILKDYKQGGYYIDITCSDDAQHIYQYHYRHNKRNRSGKMKNAMRCTVFTLTWSQQTDISLIEYPPLEDGIWLDFK